MANLRIDLGGAPKFVQKQLFGTLKNGEMIKSALEYFEGHAHVNEIFWFANYDSDKGKWLSVRKMNKRAGKEEVTVPVSLAAIQRDLKIMEELGEVKKLGERSGRWATPDYEGEVEDGEAEDESEAEDEYDE